MLRVRKSMAELVYDYVSSRDTDRVAFLNTYPGSGKTITTIKTLIDNEFIFIYTSPAHRTVKENIADRFFIPHVKSRTKLCINDTYRKLERYGVDLSTICKGVCADRRNCEYYKRIHEIFLYPQAWAGVHAHIPNLVQNYLNSYEATIDAVVIDEHFIDSILFQLKVNYWLLKKNMDMLDRINDCKEKTILMKTFEEIARVIPEGRDIFDYNYVRGLLGTKFNFEEINKKYDRHLINMFERTGFIFMNIVRPISNMLINLKGHLKTPNYFEAMVNVIYNKATGAHYVDFNRYQLESLNINVPIIVLDATTPPSIYESIFNKELLLLDTPRPTKGTYYQVVDGAYPMKSLQFKNTFERLANVVKLITKLHNKTLIVCRKDFKKKVDKFLGQRKSYAIEHYGHIRGTNEYNDFDACVLFGAPFPNSIHVERKAKLLKVPYDQLYYMEKEMEMLQALDRIRPALKDESYIYILSKVGRDEIKDVPFITTKKLQLNELKKLLQTEYIIKTSVTKVERIKRNIFACLEEGETMHTTLIKKVSGEYGLAWKIIAELVDAGEIIKKVRHTGKYLSASQRPTTYYSLP